MCNLCEDNERKPAKNLNFLRPRGITLRTVLETKLLCKELYICNLFDSLNGYFLTKIANEVSASKLDFFFCVKRGSFGENLLLLLVKIVSYMFVY